MPQFLKEDVRVRIEEAALQVFADKGYGPSTMAEIARAAGVSTGNLYLYFSNKEVLFEAVLPDSFASTLLKRIRLRVEALSGISDIRTLDTSAPYHLLSEELLQFCIEHRKRVVFLLAKAQGTKHANFAERTVALLVKLALAYARSVGSGEEPSVAMSFALERIYWNFVAAMVAALERSDDPAEIRAVVDIVSDYHRAGLRALLVPAEVEPSKGAKVKKGRSR